MQTNLVVETHKGDRGIYLGQVTVAFLEFNLSWHQKVRQTQHCEGVCASA